VETKLHLFYNLPLSKIKVFEIGERGVSYKGEDVKVMVFIRTYTYLDTYNILRK
jgi:hypothetical protein